MKSASRFLKKNGGTILAIGASVGVVLTAIETGKASIKAEKLIEMNSAEPAYTMKEKVQDCWKFYLPAAALGAGTIACILGSNALNKKQIANLTAGYMALGKVYQEYRREVAEHVGAEHEKEIYKEAALLEAFYRLKRDFALNGYASMNDLYNYLGLDYIPEGDLKGWCADYLATDWEYFWIDFSYLKQKTDDGLEVYYVEAYQDPIDDYLNYDPSKDTPF